MYNRSNRFNRSNTFYSKTETGPIRRAERCGFRPRLDTAIFGYILCTSCIQVVHTLRYILNNSDMFIDQILFLRGLKQTADNFRQTEHF